MTKGFASGSQDWGGRRAENPPGCPRVTRAEVLLTAAKAGVEVKREGLGMWWIRYPGDDCWRTLAQTNYRAVERIRAKNSLVELEKEEK